MNFFVVGIGGFIGAILRYELGLLTKWIAPGLIFPLGTFIANISGAFFIGMAFEYFTRNASMGSAIQLFVMVGLMGGFTTFSSFSLETINLITEDKILLASVNVIVSIILCLAGVWLGKTVMGWITFNV